MSDLLAGVVLNDRYQIIKKIGSGSYGIVYLTRHLYTNKLYAIKLILKKQQPHPLESTSKQLLQDLEYNLLQQAGTELAIHNNLLNLKLIEKYGNNCKILKEISLQLKVHKHPNILSIYKVYDNPSCLFVVMDYYEEGDLFQSIVDKKLYQNNPNMIKTVFIQLVDAINYCHSHSVYHCDLKPENILVADNGNKLVIADFGLSLTEEYISSSVSCGSSYYMAPERNDYQIEGEIPTNAGDVWSLSIILINLISIRNPWLKLSMKDNTFNAFLKDSSILLKILPISQEIYDLLSQKYLVLNPFKRHNLFEFRHDILNIKKFSSVGPLSVDCDPTLNSCLIPYNHVDDNSSDEMETTFVPSTKTHPDISNLLNSETPFNSSSSSSSSSCTVDDELVITPPNTYPPSPILGDSTDAKRVNLGNMINGLNLELAGNIFYD